MYLVDMRLIENHKAKMAQNTLPGSMVRQNRGMHRVWVGKQHVGKHPRLLALRLVCITIHGTADEIIPEVPRALHGTQHPTLVLR